MVNNLDKSDDKFNFRTSLQTDRDHFLRRTCPSCGRDYKTEINEQELAWALAPQFKRMGMALGQNDTSHDAQTTLWCPYCGEDTDASDTLTEDTIEYAKRLILREFILPQIHQTFSGLNSKRSLSKGLISMKLSYTRSMLPPRPIHGPEPPDMKIIHYLCCDKKAKVSEDWHGVNSCTYCGESVQVV